MSVFSLSASIQTVTPGRIYSGGLSIKGSEVFCDYNLYNSYRGVLGYCLMLMYGEFIVQELSFILLSPKAERNNNISAPVRAEYYIAKFIKLLLSKINKAKMWPLTS